MQGVSSIVIHHTRNNINTGSGIQGVVQGKPSWLTLRRWKHWWIFLMSAPMANLESGSRSSRYILTASSHLMQWNSNHRFNQNFRNPKSHLRLPLNDSTFNHEFTIAPHRKLQLWANNTRNLSRSSWESSSVRCSPVAMASSSLSCSTSLFNRAIISLGSSSSFKMASFLIKATRCAKQQVDMDSWKVDIRVNAGVRKPY